MRLRAPQLLAAGLLVLAGLGEATAQARHPCATLAVAAERLTCYDRAFPPQAAAAPASPSQAPAASAAAEAPVPKRPEAATAFGLPPQPAPVPTSEVREISAVVMRIDSNSRGERVFALDNGQRWMQAESGRSVPLAEGAAVTIERAAFGGFRLVTPAGAGLRVRRLP